MFRGAGTLPAGPFVEWAEMIAAELGGIVAVERLMGIDNQTFVRAVCRARKQQAVTLGLVDALSRQPANRTCSRSCTRRPL